MFSTICHAQKSAHLSLDTNLYFSDLCFQNCKHASKDHKEEVGMADEIISPKSSFNFPR